jgi:hypothetical protein
MVMLQAVSRASEANRYSKDISVGRDVSLSPKAPCSLPTKLPPLLLRVQGAASCARMSLLARTLRAAGALDSQQLVPCGLR